MSDPNEGKVVSVTNITDKDFSHQYGGVPYFVPAGQTLMFPFFLGKHLAKHLARKILLSTDKGATVYDPKDPSMSNGNGTVIWNEQTENEMIGRILGETFTHEVQKPKTEMELLREHVEALNKKFNTPQEPMAPVSADGFKDKGQIIEELRKMGQPVDARKSKATLEAQLEAAKKVTA